MSRTALIVLAALLALGACEQDAGETTPSPLGKAEVMPHALPPPAASTPRSTPRFVGRWAWADDRCAQDAWTFRAGGLSTPGEVSCEWRDIREVPGGYDVSAACIAQAPPQNYVFQLRFAESARAMMVDGGPMGAVSLVYCGP